ncbi:MAG: DUF393 domain-containing protein [Bacteroidetes bacterium]|nr:DUF393 domain-containing protein [Bacteroidota bacterium]
MELKQLINTTTKPIIFFDGYCNLCNVAIQLIIKHDQHQQFLFSTLTGEFALANNLFGHIQMEQDTMALWVNNRLYIRSDAVIEIAKRLGGWFVIISYTKIFPKFIRNGVYNIIAKSRYRLFGKRANCMIPDQALLARFVK